MDRKTWADAAEFALSRLPGSLYGKKVLEIGAGPLSCMSPIFARKGAESLCSYYRHSQTEVENGRLKFIMDKYGIEKIPVKELDINDVEEVYDIIVMKSVLGGLCREDDYIKLRTIIEKLLTQNLRRDGYIITLDNGHINLFIRLRNFWGSGANKWTYFKREKLLTSLSNYKVDTQGFGFLNFGEVRFFRRGNYEFLNDFIHVLDKAILRLIKSEERAVLATIVGRT